MYLAQTKSVEIFFTALIFLALFSSAIHAKDVFAPKLHKLGRDDSGSVVRKVVDDSHNHTDKFSFKAAKLSTTHAFGADNRSLKKQFVFEKKLQKLLD
jgi:hypothetical protein